MPNINEFFPSSGDWLKVADLGGRAIKATVSEVRVIQVSDFNDKDVKHPALEIHFQGAEKSFVCKKWNSENIAQGYGPNTDNWIGKKVTLKPGKSSNGHDMIVAEPELEVSEGFSSPLEKQLNDVAKEFGGSRMTDEDVPF